MSGFAQIGPGLLVLMGTFLIGLGTGVFLRRSGVRTARAEAERLGQDLGTTRSQLANAEETLLAAQRELEQQSSAISKHFERTSELFRDLTRQYTALYSHLAEGARELCPDQRIPLGVGFGEPLLAAGPEPAPEIRAEEDGASRAQAEAQLEAVRRAAERVAETAPRADARQGV
jgi:uncharacterized membrane-anchored protein YhcB (DUF1043 family)